MAGWTATARQRLRTAAVAVVECGAESVALAAVSAMDGSERLNLLIHLCATDPEVVNRGVAGLAEWHAAAAEHRRAENHRKAKARRRRQRAQA